MKKMLTAAIAVSLVIICGCNSNTSVLTEMAKDQQRQADKVEKITELIEQQNKNIAVLRKQAEANAVMRAAFSKALKAKLAAKSDGNSKENMIEAALLLAKYGPGNINSQAISILGYLGGERAENALLEMLGDGSYTRNSSYIIRALVAMRSSKLRPVIIKLLESGNSQSINTAMGAINNRSLNILKKADLPLILKILDNMPNHNNNRYNRNNILKLVCLLDQDVGVEYICEELETADANQQRDLVYIPLNAQINLSTKSWQKIIKALGEPNSQNIRAFQALCDAISRKGDLRLMDAASRWADFAIDNSSFSSSYIQMLNRLRDPKTAEIFLDLCLNSKRNNNYYKNYLKNFPGITQENGEYKLVGDLEMKKLLKNRAKIISRLNERDERRASKKEK